MTTVAHTPKKGYRTIRLPLAESEYDRFLTDRSYAKDRLEDLYGECAELFPEAFPWGYSFFGFTEPSIKQQLLCRRIRLDPRSYGLYHRPRLCHALHDGAYPRRRPSVVLDAISCALLGHCSRVWPRCDVLVSPGTKSGSLQSRRHDGQAPRALPQGP